MESVREVSRNIPTPAFWGCRGYLSGGRKGPTPVPLSITVDVTSRNSA